MTTHTVYLVDANVLIEAKNRYYSFSIFPGFWDAIVWHAGSGSVCSNDADVVAWYRRITNWVQNELQFRPEAKAEFMKAADPWLVAPNVNLLQVLARLTDTENRVHFRYCRPTSAARPGRVDARY